MSDTIKDYLIDKINSEITLLGANRFALSKVDINNSLYHVVVWSEDHLNLVDNDFSGSISDAVRAAEYEFKIKNKLNTTEKIHPQVFMVNMVLADQKYFIPGEYWEQYRNKL